VGHRRAVSASAGGVGGRSFPGLIRHALLDLKERRRDALPGPADAEARWPEWKLQGEVVTDVKTRPEGTRVKHRLNRNSIKSYDKQARSSA